MTILTVVKEVGTYIETGAVIGVGIGGYIGIVSTPSICLFSAIDHYADCLAGMPFTSVVIGAVVGGGAGAGVYVIKEVFKRCAPPVVTAVAGLLGYRITRLEQQVN